jgi:hypothetical protein
MDRSFCKPPLAALCAMVMALLLLSAPLLAQKRDSLYDPKKTVIYKNGKFKVYNNWISAGGGAGYNFTHYGQQFILGADYNFHIRQEYFQLGFFFMGDRFGEYNNFNYHFAYGRRVEKERYNLACFAGLAYSTGYKKINGVFRPDDVYDQVGLYACAQYIQKITYDTGIGPGIYFDINPYQTVAGIRLDVYFSGAYKGKVRE